MNELLEQFSNYPDLDEHIRQHPDPLVREEYTIRLKQLRQPFLIYYECFRAIETAIKDGYSTKNPFSPTTAQYLHYPVDDCPGIEPKTGYFEPKAENITLTGASGVGKTSMLEQILNYLPGVIEHDVYQGHRMEFIEQVVWIKVECPNNSSVRDLCEEILAALDLAMGREKSAAANTIGSLMRQIEQRIKSSFLGLLVIDEMQRLVFKRTGGENNLLNFLHSLVNKLGVPLFFCGNPPFDDTLSKTLKAARRAESSGYFRMEPLKRESDEWEAFIGELWEIQWTCIYNELTVELNDKMYELSLGNLDIAHRIYREAQRLVILADSDDERINTGVLEQAYARACGLSSGTDEIKMLRSQIALPGRHRGQKMPGIQCISTAAHTLIADVTRPQHPEFDMKLRELVGAVDLPDRIGDPDIFQRAAGQEHPIDMLRLEGIIEDDPLVRLA
ncbi:ATP-binding protein [Citrobacter werkmanii]|uniref:ATP-binding protein n=1 Tax=Citrobacter werkmanii TaxID=67827 RepID=UPI0026566FC6|nr:ATP-binding protein [Citrobacter werkmanii]MDN8558367.1 ATP-binding protein [Citrobacter werkmanii]